MTKILKTMSLGSAGGERQNRVQPVKSLDRALFIDTEDRRVGWRINVQANNVGGFLFKLEDRRWSYIHATAEAEYRNGAKHG